MANLVVCCVFDSVISSFGRPFYVTHIGAATRSFTDEVNNDKSEFYKHPSDFSLYEIGTFDDEIAKFDTFDVPRLVCRASDVRNSNDGI